MGAYATLYKRVLYPLYEEHILRRKTLQYLAEMERTQWLPRREIEQRQWRQLEEMLAHCERHVPYYGRLFADAGVKASQIQSPSDLARIPVLTKDIVRAREQDLIALPYKGRKLAHTASSGTTGHPVQVYYDHESYERRVAAWMRGDRWVGWDIGERMFLLVGSRPRVRQRMYQIYKKQLYEILCRQRSFTALDMSEEVLLKYFHIMNRFRAPVVVGYANTLVYFAQFIRDRGLAPFRPKSVVIIAEKIFPPQKQLIEEVFQAPVYERYGCMEFSFIAAECERRTGMHVNCDNLYVEILNEEGKPAAPGELGEFVFTSLHNRAMPFVRYKLGDLGYWSTQTCRCGRGMPLIGDVTGRTLDMVVTATGKVCAGVIFPYVLDLFPEIVQYQAVQETAEELLLRIVPRGAVPAQRLREIEGALRRFMGDEIRIRIELTERIPLTAAGKFAVFQSKVAQPFGQRPRQRELVGAGAERE